MIGIEELKDSTLRLLLFDPSCTHHQMEALITDVKPQTLRTLRRSVTSMTAAQYQIVAVESVINDETQYQVCKINVILNFQ